MTRYHPLRSTDPRSQPRTDPLDTAEGVIVALRGCSLNQAFIELVRMANRHHVGPLHLADVLVVIAENKPAVALDANAVLAANAQLRGVVAAKLDADWSPQQIAQWLRREYLDDAAMRVSHESKRTSLAHERTELARDNQLRHRVHDFAARIHAAIDTLDDTQKQQLLRLLIDDVRVTGWHVQIRLRIALDPPPPDPTSPTHPKGKPSPPHPRPVSSQNGLRSVGGPQGRLLPHQRPRPRASPRINHRRMNTKGVNFQPSERGQFSTAVDSRLRSTSPALGRMGTRGTGTGQVLELRMRRRQGLFALPSSSP